MNELLVSGETAHQNLQIEINLNLKSKITNWNSTLS